MDKPASQGQSENSNNEKEEEEQNGNGWETNKNTARKNWSALRMENIPHTNRAAGTGETFSQSIYQSIQERKKENGKVKTKLEQLFKTFCFKS